jgi:hypothetical protein
MRADDHAKRKNVHARHMAGANNAHALVQLMRLQTSARTLDHATKRYNNGCTCQALVAYEQASQPILQFSTNAVHITQYAGIHVAVMPT